MKSASKPRSSRARPKGAGRMPWSVTNVDTPNFTAAPWDGAWTIYGNHMGTRPRGNHNAAHE
ncbi:hypothetical protein SVIO_096680 [Streptomyces violaceusniger]|uniref:Uncharacterized protein n=1 Tax=Streptomyces violaceusniger TaxID=68280 RepID=A0A4D4LD59_STRVO|nr:hypothetical protein SVIO_096680 [Streptomyces violaceusniger]